MKILFLITLALSVTFLSGFVPAAERAYQIDTITVTERPLFGGFGGSGHLGDVTEFFVPELAGPLVSVGGQHSALFVNRNVIYIYKDGEEYSICPEDRLTRSCLPCSECVHKIDALKRFDVKNRQYSAKKVMGSFSYMVMETSGEMLHFSKGAQGSLMLTAKHGMTGRHIYPGVAFQDSGKVYVMKADDDPAYYLCPKENFSAGVCYVCVNCEEKIGDIKATLQ